MISWCNGGKFCCMNKINYLAKTNFRSANKRFGIKQADRRQHIYIIGKTGVGKSTLLENMMLQDLQQAGRGFALIDPHGGLAERLLDAVPDHRLNDVIYFNPSDLANPTSLNILFNPNPEQRHIVASDFVLVLKRLWASGGSTTDSSWGHRMEHYLRNILLALLEQEKPTLLHILTVLNDENYRNKIIRETKDPVVQMFWKGEFGKHHERYVQEAISPIQNRIGKFMASLPLRYSLGQSAKSIDPRQVMDEGKVFIANLSKGRLGEDESNLLGSLISSMFQFSALQRVDTAEEQRKDFHLFIDEFQNFTTSSFATILSEARKYRLSLVIAHQYINQLSPVIKDAVMGNVGTIISFAVGAEDAEELVKEFKPAFTAEDLVFLEKYNVIMKLTVNGASSRAFSAQTLEPIPFYYEGNKEKVIALSKRRFSRSRKKVEGDVGRILSGRG